MRPLVHTKFSFILTSILFYWSVCLFLHSLNSFFFFFFYWLLLYFHFWISLPSFHLKISVTTTCHLSFSHKWVNYGSKQPPKLSGLTQEFISFSECIYHVSWCASESGDGICSATSQVPRLTEVPTLFSDTSQLLSHQSQGKAAGELCTS